MIIRRRKIQNPPEETAIFLHIPKTAGTTLNHIISRQYYANDLYSIEQEVSEHRGTEEVFAKFHPDKRSGYRMIYGHVSFGMHEQIPIPAVYFTLLREPLQLINSLYLHARRSNLHNLHTEVRNQTLKEVFKEGKIQAFDNFQTRAISGVWHDLPFGECNQQMLEQAKKNLQEHFAVVGVTKRFDETLMLLQQRFNWRNVFYARHNVAKKGQESHKIDDETRDLVVSQNRFDEELYAFAERLCDEQIKSGGEELEKRVSKFRTLNRYLSWEDKLYWEMRKVSVRELLRNRS